MRRIMYIIIVASLFAVGCTKDNFIDTGVSNGRHEGKSLLEYMEAHPYDWSFTVEMVRHAGEEMVRLFEGKDEAHLEITFFGLANHSIRRYLLTNNIKSVSDLDPAWCRSVLLKHVVDGKIYRRDIPEGKPGDYGTRGSGGKSQKNLAGEDVWTYVFVEEKEGVVDNAPRSIYVNFLKSGKGNFRVASGDIEPDNCVVHALEYKFTLGDE
ncbi:hypothetical protein [Butyricimonas synergistica]|uniref:hypothetical protein n=1 Tax=Butyricimonas synergistica TaxID=544644 RepID=UPI0003A70E06|nr:hypothetical protein [Butyricimonas synergistica]